MFVKCPTIYGLGKSQLFVHLKALKCILLFFSCVLMLHRFTVNIPGITDNYDKGLQLYNIFLHEGSLVNSTL